MTTECNASYLDFPMLGSRQVLADFDGGDITSDGGALLLRQTEQLTAILHQFAACFTDRRDPLLATVVGKQDPTGQSRQRRRDRGKALAGKSTLNRLELTPVGADEDSRCKRVRCRTHDVGRLFVT